MKYILIILISCSCIFNLLAQKTIQFSGYSIELTDIVETDKSKFQHRNNLSNTAELFFNQYFFSDDLAQYKNLYIKGEFYGLTTVDYSKWQETIRSTDIIAEHLIYLSSGGIHYAAFPYQADYDHYIHRHVKLAKQVDGRWFALSQKEATGMAELKKFLILVNSTYLMQLVRNGKIDFYDSNMSRSSQLTSNILMDVREKVYLNPDYISTHRQLPFQSTFEWTKSGLRKFQSQIKPDIITWLAAMNFTSQQQNQIVHLLYRGEQIEAVVMVDELEGDQQKTVNDYIKELKGIFSKF